MPFNNTTALSTTTQTTASDATRLRVLAGTPHNRRGSVLVLVVGVLALLAIIIVVYTSVGQADVRGGRTLVNQARLDDQSHAISDYIRVVVGNDASAVKVQPVSIATGVTVNMGVREATDYPYTDPYSRSQLVAPFTPASVNVQAARFDPAGNITTQWTTAGGGLDPRVPSDPFLASTEPTWINRGFAALPNMPTTFALMGLHRDWAHMSLVSPSGLPVNLANLRGNWSAPSGFSARPYAVSTPQNISDFLYLWPHTSNNAGYMTPTLPAQAGGVAIYNQPATWSNDRTNTFRPTTWNPGKLVMGDVKFMGNTLADADGDGMYDSLWQELVDVSDPANPVNLLPGGTGGGVRWFIAPRIIDLSSMINVNTATSFAVPPDVENPAGLTPSDIDLERWLTTADARQYFGIDPAATYVAGANTYGGASAGDITDAGRWAFAGILEGRATGLVEVVDNQYIDVAGSALFSPPWLNDMGVQRTGGGGPALGSVTRTLLYTLGGKDDANGQLRTPNGTTAGHYLQQPSGYGLGDELELRANGGVNDPRTRARIEASAATRATANPAFARWSPFRSDRDLVTDRDAGLNLLPANVTTFGGETVPRVIPQYFSDARHGITTLSGARPIAYSAALLLTPTTSAARTMTDVEIRLDINTLLQNALSNATSAQNTTRRSYPLSAANTIFTNYALALSPFLGALDPLLPTHPASESLWNEASGGNNLRNLTLSFGGVTYDVSGNATQIGETITPTFKGRPTEIAVRAAAHTALNAMVTRDDTVINASSTQPDNRMLAATVLFDELHRDDVEARTYTSGARRFPFWRANGRLGTNDTTSLNPAGTNLSDIKAYTFDLNGGQPGTKSLLAGPATTPAMTKGYAVNIFAAQPQPFITAAVSFDMYYDAPGPQGGDSMAISDADLRGEWVVTDPGDAAAGRPPTTRSLGITIKGDVDLANPDFLMEAIAFQVTNPFDVTLTLGDPNNNNFSYYFEFAGKFYDARAYDDLGNVTTVKILPRQTMNFYVLSQPPASVLSRWTTADPGIGTLTGGGLGGTSPLTAWIKKQLIATTGGGAAVRTVQVNRTNGSQINPGPLNKILASNPTSDDNKVVKLWRVVLDRNAGEASTTNKTENDYLVDRLHEPTFGDTNQRSALFRRLNTDYNRFTDIPAGPEPSDGVYYQGPTEQKENVGYSITMFGAVRRRTDPSGGPLPGQLGDATAGVMPAWCVEAKNGPGFSAPLKARNIADANTDFPNANITTGISPGNFTSHEWGARSFRTMISKGLGRAYTTAARHPATRFGVGAVGSGGMGDDPADKMVLDIDGVDWVAGGKAMQLPVFPRRSNTITVTNTDVKLPPLRPADLLMPWAIGPYQYGDMDPVPANEDVRNITLSEAMALGLNYSRGTDNKSYEFQIGQVLDRCHLPTDRQVPFNDANSNAKWDYNNGNPDPSISNGIPFALNVLDRFRTTRYGSIDSVMPGLININTASLNVLRTLPFLTPASANIFGTDGNGYSGSWMNSTAAGPFALALKNENGTLVSPTPSLWANNERWDLAATLIAYRDQQAVVARGEQGTETGNAVNNGRVYVDYSRGTTTAAGNDGNLFNASSTVRTGRPFMTNIPSARQEMGFQTPGEVLMALVQDNTQRVPGVTLSADDLKRLSIDRMVGKLNPNGSQAKLNNFQTPVHPIQNIAARGLTTPAEASRDEAIGLTYSTPIRKATTGNTEHFVQGGKSSDYDRKIAIANALLNTISTSSDLYCAYFLVNGYTEADTQGLETYTGNAIPTEDRYTRPMIPSIQRRYMMVLDRSGCVRAGDKPKVLMFEELPVK